MSLEICSIREVISYQVTPRTGFVVGTGIVKSKANENESITFNILQFIPVDIEISNHCVPLLLSPRDVINFYGSVTTVDLSIHEKNFLRSIDPTMFAFMQCRSNLINSYD